MNKFKLWDIENRQWLPLGCIEYFENGDIIVNEELPLTFQGKQLRELVLFSGRRDKDGVDIYFKDIVEWDGEEYEVMLSENSGEIILKDDREDWECPGLYAQTLLNSDRTKTKRLRSALEI